MTEATLPVSSTGTFRRDHVPELDGLRAVAALLVLWVHLPAASLGAWTKDLRVLVLPGQAGIDLFFVLSGFLITRILLHEREQGIPLRYFLLRRFLRIFPIYYLTIAVLWSELDLQERIALPTYTSNFVFAFREAPTRMRHAWSLAVEEQFYLVWPPLVACLTPAASRRVLLAVFLPLGVLCAAGALLFADWSAEGRLWTELVLHGSPVRFATLGAGALVAYHETALRRSRPLAWTWVVLLVLGAWSLSLRGLQVWGGFERLLELPSVGGKVRWILVPLRVVSVPLVQLAILVAVLAGSGRGAPHLWLLRSRPLTAIGRVSYGLYLYHYPVFNQPGLWGWQVPPAPWRVAFALGATLLLATVSYWAIERPLLRWAARFRSGLAPVRRGPGLLQGLLRFALALAAIVFLNHALSGGVGRSAAALAP